jgi:glycosyltransferase involved in cell wall biosynthesis
MRTDLDAAGVPVWTAGGDPAWSDVQEVIPAIARWSPDAVHIHAQRVDDDVVHTLHKICPAHTVFVEKNVWGQPSSFRSVLDVSCQLTTWGIWAYEQHLPSQNGVEASPGEPLLVTVPNSIDLDVFYPPPSDERAAWRRTHDIPEDAFVLGRVGQSYPGKSHPAPLGMVRQLREQGIDAWLVSVAPADSFRTAARKCQEAVRSHVRILDRIDDHDTLRKTYGAFDVFVHVTTQGETFGNVLAEAQACKVPVVTKATPHRDNSQCIVVKNGETGFVVAKWHKLFDAVSELARNPSLRSQMGEAGYEHVRSQYANEAVTQRLLTIFDLGLSASSKDEFRTRLIEHDIMSGRSATEDMAEHLSNCYGGLPLNWALWNRFDGTTGVGFKLARKLEHWRRTMAERFLLNV